MLTLFPTWSILELEKDLRRRCFRIDELRDHPFCSVLPSLLGEELTTAAACKQKNRDMYIHSEIQKKASIFRPSKINWNSVRTHEQRRGRRRARRRRQILTSKILFRKEIHDGTGTSFELHFGEATE